ADQLDWVAQELSTTDKQTIAYFHHPLSVPSWGKSTCCFEDDTERDNLAAVLEAGGVDHVINGHSQGYDWRWLTTSDVASLQEGLYQLISGGGGGNIAQPDGAYHFTLVHVTPDAITHQVFELEDTDIVVDENKAGDEVTVEYDGVADLPYLRLKFKLDNDISQHLIADAEGNYLEYQAHSFADYSVVFVNVAVSRGTTTFTALPANTIHTGISQTVDTTGYITFTTAPTTVATNTAMTVLPSKLTTTISAVTQTDNGYTWLEQPASRSINTTYSLGDLTAEADVRVYVNDELFTRGRSDADGTFNFTYTPNKIERNFSVVVQSELTDVITVPTDSGTAHVRTFTTAGENIGNFFSANQRMGSFRLGYSNITNESELALLVTERETGRLFLHSSDGKKLDTISISNKVSSTANRLMVDQGNGIRTYRWSNKKQQLQAIDRWQLPSPLVDWTLVDNDIVAVIKRSSAQRPPRYILMTAQRTKRLPKNITDVHILSCRCQTTAATVTMVTWRTNNRRYISSYSSDLVRLSYKTIRLSGDIEQWIAGHPTDRLLDTVIMVSDGTAYLLQAKGSGKLKRLPNVTAVDRVGIVNDQLVVTTNERPSQVIVYDYNNLLDVFELDESFYPYGETFTGGVTLALP
ncbi:MAG TPA: hypothetical protein DEG44_06140, partial [Candidatus Kerfeldbacteria bacterium]|nr:hypothetical protein [Candidatus Kerfeldbacteria bacterium]